MPYNTTMIKQYNQLPFEKALHLVVKKKLYWFCIRGDPSDKSIIFYDYNPMQHKQFLKGSLKLRIRSLIKKPLDFLNDVKLYCVDM